MILRGLRAGGVALALMAGTAGAQTVDDIVQRYGIVLNLQLPSCEIARDDVPVFASAFTLLRTLDAYRQTCGFDHTQGFAAHGLSAGQGPDRDAGAAKHFANLMLWRCAEDRSRLRGAMRKDDWIEPAFAQCNPEQHARFVDEAARAVRELQSRDPRSLPGGRRGAHSGERHQ